MASRRSRREDKGLNNKSNDVANEKSTRHDKRPWCLFGMTGARAYAIQERARARNNRRHSIAPVTTGN